MPSPCPPHPPRPSVYCTCYPGNPMGRMQIRGTNETDPHLPSQFTLMMTNTFVHGEGRWEFQYASNHCSPQISPSLLLSKPLTYLFFISFFSSFQHIPAFSGPISTFAHNPFFLYSISAFFAFGRPLRADGEGHKARTQQMAAVVCERSVLSKQTHWVICFSTLHQAGSSEESAHHFNQPRQHTMNL